MSRGVILQVEDDEDDVLLLDYVLKKERLALELHSVPDGDEAIAWLSGQGDYGDRKRFPLPDLVLLDVKMPHLDGFEVLRHIRAGDQTRAIVVVMLSASANQMDVDRAYALGANAFAIKPAGTDRLAELVRALHAFWFVQNRFATPGE